MQSKFNWTNDDPVGYQLWKKLYQEKIQNNNMYQMAVQKMCRVNCKHTIRVDLVQEKHLVQGKMDKHTGKRKMGGTSVTSFWQKLKWVKMFPAFGFKCTLMHLVNLADPKWMSIKCEKLWLGNLMCMVQNNRNPMHEPKAQSPDLHRQKSCFMKKTSCYGFIWSSAREGKRMIAKEKHGPVSVQFDSLRYIFDAIDVSFPPIFTQDFSYFTTYKRYLNAYIFENHKVKNNSIEAFYIKKINSPSFSTKSGNIFECSKGVFISHVLLCDGKQDCTVDESDEMGCKCNSNGYYHSKCKYIISTNEKGVCSIFYHFLSNGNCKLYWISSNKMLSFQNQTFPCKNGHRIPKSMQNDLVSDCGPKAEDEMHLHYLSHYKEIYKCHEMSQIPCRKHHSKCYSIWDICIYKLDKFGLLSPCRTGEHLHNCTFFECNMQFKCSGFYCIPWGYVCDGKWDCPGGLDESNIYSCGSKRKCKNMFKCQKSDICIHVGDICNGISDCPFSDDEHLCLLQDAVCPSNCECLDLTLGCFGVYVNENIDLIIHISPYIAVFIENCSMVFTYKMLQKLGQINILSAKRNNLLSICSFIPTMAISFLYDIGFNSISTIDENCFNNGTKIVEIRLNNNHITYLHPLAFEHLYSLQCLNLSNNNLLELQHIIFTFTSLRLLLIQNNKFINVYPSILYDFRLELLVTNDFAICCTFQKSVLCTIRIQWFKLCSNLFHKTVIKVVSYVCFSLVFITNCFYIFVDTILNKIKCRKSVTFVFTIKSMCFSNFLYSGYLFIMILSDFFYGKTFPQNQQMWQEGPFCATAFAMSFIYSFMSPILLCYLSMLRFLVIFYPLNFSIKKINVGLKPILFTNLSIILLAMGLTVVVWNFSPNVALVLCSPFVDPANASISIKLTAWALATLQQASCIFISVIYLLIISQIRKRDKSMEDVKVKSQLTFPIIFQMVGLVSSGLVSWISSSIILIVTLTRNSYPIELIYWLHIVIMPTNAIIVPFIFLVTTIRQWKF